MGKIDQDNNRWNDEELKIEHDVRMTDGRFNKGRKHDNIRRAILSMGIGDSVLFRDKNEAKKFFQRAYKMSRRKEVTGHWALRKVNDSAWRIWRVK